MNGVRVVLNRAGVRELLKSVEVRDELERRAKQIAAEAGTTDRDGTPDHVVAVTTGRNRARAVVVTATPAAMVAEARDRNLTTALDAGRR